MTYLHQLANNINMPYVNIIVNVDSAVNAYNLLWSYPVSPQDVVILFGRIYIQEENFKV